MPPGRVVRGDGRLAVPRQVVGPRIGELSRLEDPADRIHLQGEGDALVLTYTLDEPKACNLVHYAKSAKSARSFLPTGLQLSCGGVLGYSFGETRTLVGMIKGQVLTVGAATH